MPEAIEAAIEQPTTQTPAPDVGVSVSEAKTPEANPNSNGVDPKPLVATGADTPPPVAEKSYWPEDWRQRVAKHRSGGVEKIYEKELARLETVPDPAALYGSYREMENIWASRRFVRLPGDDAKPEDIAAFHKALGVPETPDAYVKDLKLDDGLVLGELDKPIVEDFAKEAHKAGVTPQQFKNTIQWYLKREEEQAAAIDESDDSFRRVSEQTLKNELGAAYKRKTNGIGVLFSHAAGGTDINNENGVYARILGGRTADGKLIGNDPDVVRWLIGLASEVNPAASVVEDTDQSGKSIDDEIASLEARMKTDRKGYFKDEPAQARYRELISARDKIRAKAR